MFEKVNKQTKDTTSTTRDYPDTMSKCESTFSVNATQKQKEENAAKQKFTPSSEHPNQSRSRNMCLLN